MRRRKNPQVKISVIILALIISLANTAVAFAASETLEEQIEKKNSELLEEKGKIAQMYAGDDAARVKLEETIKNLSKKEDEVKQKTEEVEKLKKEQQEIRKMMQLSEEEMNKRLRNMYKTGSLGFIDIVLSSDNVVDAVENITMASYIYDQDQEVVAALQKEDEQMSGSVKKEEEALEKLQKEQETLEKDKSDMESSAAASKESITAAEQNIVSLDKDLAALQEQYKKEHDGKEYEIKKTVNKIEGGGLEAAYSLLGVPYVWGGTSPTGTDCSGLVCQVYGYARGRTTYEMIASMKSSGDWKTSLDSLKVGDLVFPEEGHVGIYIGGGQMIHASMSAHKVIIGKVYAFYGGGTY